MDNAEKIRRKLCYKYGHEMDRKEIAEAIGASRPIAATHWSIACADFRLVKGANGRKKKAVYKTADLAKRIAAHGTVEDAAIRQDRLKLCRSCRWALRKSDGTHKSYAVGCNYCCMTDDNGAPHTTRTLMKLRGEIKTLNPTKCELYERRHTDE